jgi:hypothetical protein
VRKPIGTGAIELYDLETDLGETTNLADAHPDIVARASAAISASRTESTEWPTGR